MSALSGALVNAAYHLVAAIAGLLAPMPAGLAAATAIIVFTAAVRMLLLPLSYRAMRGLDAKARLVPKVQALRARLAGQPDRLQQEITALYRAEGTTALAGCLPLLAQWPFLAIVYLLFRSPVIAGAPNVLLAHDLFGASLGSHWLGGPGPLSAHGAVFAVLFVLLAAVGWTSAWLARRRQAAGPTTALDKTEAAAAPGQAANPGPVAPAARSSAALAALTPYLTIAVAAFVPLAAGLYLLTTSAWTLAERAILRLFHDREGLSSADLS